MASKIEIEYRAAVNEAVADIEKVNTAVGGAGAASQQAGIDFTNLKSALDLGIGAFKAIKGAAEAVINPTVDYAASVRDLQRTIGATAEESSKLIQAADDMGISSGTLSAALQAAIRKGVKPTVEGIGALADEYNAIQDPIARTKFLMDNFGRSGAALAPLMEQGAAGIAAMGDEAERMGLVMGQDAVDAARQYELAVDNLEDSMLALKIQIAEGVMPVLTNLFTEMATGTLLQKQLNAAAEDGVITQAEAARVWQEVRMGVTSASDAQAELNGQVSTHQKRLEEVDPYIQNMRASTEEITAATVEYSNQLSSQDQWLRDITVHTQEAQIAQENSSGVMQALAAGLSGTLTKAQEDYRDVLAETQPEIDKLNAKLAEYQAAQGQTVTVITEAQHSVEEYELAQIKAATAAQKLAEYTGDNREEYLQLKIASDNAQASVVTMGEQMGITEQFTLDYTTRIQEANGSIAELTLKQAEAEAQLALTTSQFLLQQVAASLTGEAQTELAYALGLIDEQSYNASIAMQELTDKYDQNGDHVITATEATEAYKNEVVALRDSIAGMQDKTVNVVVNTIRNEYNNTGGATYGTDGYEHGPGRASGGPVYGGQGYMVGEQGPEPFFPAGNGYIMNHNDGKSLVGALQSIAQSLAQGAGAVHNYYGYGSTGDTGDSRALAGALA